MDEPIVCDPNISSPQDPTQSVSVNNTERTENDTGKDNQTSLDNGGISDSDSNCSETSTDVTSADIEMETNKDQYSSSTSLLSSSSDNESFSEINPESPEEISEVFQNNFTESSLKDLTKSSCQDSTQSPCQDSTKSPCKDSTISACKDSTESACKDSTKSPCKDSTISACKDSTKSPCKDSTISACKDSTISSCKDSPQSLCQDSTESACKDLTKSSCQDSNQSSFKDSTESPCKDSTKSPCKDLTQSPCQDSTQTSCQDSTISQCKDSAQSPCGESTESLQQNSSGTAHQSSTKSSLPQKSTESPLKDSNESLEQKSSPSTQENSIDTEKNSLHSTKTTNDRANKKRKISNTDINDSDSEEDDNQKPSKKVCSSETTSLTACDVDSNSNQQTVKEDDENEDKDKSDQSIFSADTDDRFKDGTDEKNFWDKEKKFQVASDFLKDLDKKTRLKGASLAVKSGLSMKKATRTFGVAKDTVKAWEKKLEEEGGRKENGLDDKEEDQEDRVKAACAAVLSGTTQRDASIQFNVSRGDIKKRIASIRDKGLKRAKKRGLSHEEEEKFHQWALSLDKAGIKCSMKQFLAAVQTYLKKLNEPFLRFNNDNRPCKTWYVNFFCRYPRHRKKLNNRSDYLETSSSAGNVNGNTSSSELPSPQPSDLGLPPKSTSTTSYSYSQSRSSGFLSVYDIRPPSPSDFSPPAGKLKDKGKTKRKMKKNNDDDNNDNNDDDDEIEQQGNGQKWSIHDFCPGRVAKRFMLGIKQDALWSNSVVFAHLDKSDNNKASNGGHSLLDVQHAPTRDEPDANKHSNSYEFPYFNVNT